MKLLLWIHLFFLFALKAATPLSAGTNNVDFKEITSLEELEAYDKPVLLYFRADWCLACRKMEQEVFSKKNISGLLNDNFVNVKVDEKQEMIRDSFEIVIYPTMIFLDAEGKTIHRMDGYQSESLLALQTDIVLQYEDKPIIDMIRNRYEADSTNPELIYDLILLLQSNYVLDSVYINRYLDLLPEEANFDDKNIEFIYRYCMNTPFPGGCRIPDENAITDTSEQMQIPKEWLSYEDGQISLKPRPEKYIFLQFSDNGCDDEPIRWGYNIPEIFLDAKSKAYSYLIDNRDLFIEKFPEEQVDLRILKLAHSAAYAATDLGDENMLNLAFEGLNSIKSINIDSPDNFYPFQYYEKVQITSYWPPFAHEVEMGFPTSIKRSFYLNTGNQKAYKELMDAYMESISNNPELLLSTSRRYYECYDEEWLLQRGLHWAESASELEPSFRAFALRALYAKRLDEAEKFTELKSLALGKATSEDRETKLFEALAGNVEVSE